MVSGYRHVKVWTRGVDSKFFDPCHRDIGWRQRLTEGESDKRLLLYVGRLSPEKRVDWLVPVLDALPDVRLAIVGDGPSRPCLERQFARHAVHFTGYLSGKDLAAAIDLSWQQWFVLQSHPFFATERSLLKIH